MSGGPAGGGMSGGGIGLMSGGGLSIGSGGRGMSGREWLFDHAPRRCNIRGPLHAGHTSSPTARIRRERVAPFHDHPHASGSRTPSGRLRSDLRSARWPRGRRARATSSVSARSCVVTRPIAPASTSARTIASAPIRRSCELVPCRISSSRNSTGLGPRAVSTIDADAQNLGVEARMAGLQRVFDPERRAERERRQAQLGGPDRTHPSAPARR